MAKPDLARLLDQAQQSKNRVRCRTCKAMAEIDAEDAATLAAALDDPEISSGTISRALTSYGVTISPSGVSRHRRECG